MITARKARDISERCSEYMDKLQGYENDVEELIKSTAHIGRTIVSFEVKEDEDRYSIVHDLKKILLENNYHVHEKISFEKFVLEIGW